MLITPNPALGEDLPMNTVSEKDQLRIARQPVIFKLRKLQISHDNPHSIHDGKRVINIYWDYRRLFSIVSGRLSIPIGRYPILQKMLKTTERHIFIPPYRK